MLHFTLSGQYAGRLVCQAPRNPLHDYMHSPSTGQLAKYIDKNGADGICPACLYEFLLTFAMNDDIAQPHPEQVEWDDETPQWVIDLAAPTYQRIARHRPERNASQQQLEGT